MFLKNKAVYALIMLGAFSASVYSQWTANWIWQSADGPADTWMCFRKTVTLASAPASAYARISAPYLTSGSNTIAAQVWYWGKEGFSHHSSGKGGFLSDANFGGTAVRSDNTWKAKVHPAYQNSTTGGQPNFRLPEFNVRFDARSDSISGWQQPGYNDANWPAATAKGVPPSEPWNTLIKRPFPQFKTRSLTDYTNAASLPTAGNGGIIDAKLPYDAHVSAYLRISGPTAGQLINIQTDMYDSMYLFGDGPSLRAEYFEAMMCFTDAKTVEERNLYFERMMACHESKARIIDSSLYEYYSQWYYSAVRALLSFHPFDGADFASLQTVSPGGTGSETVIGKIVQEDGTPARGTMVMLLPYDFDPASDPLHSDYGADTTDSEGISWDGVR